MKNRIAIIRKAYFPIKSTRNNEESIKEFAREINATLEEIKYLEKYPYINSNNIPVLVENIADKIFKRFGLPKKFTFGYVLILTEKTNLFLPFDISGLSEELKFCELAKAGFYDYHNQDVNKEYGSDDGEFYQVVRSNGVLIKKWLSPEDVNSLLVNFEDDEDDDDNDGDDDDI